VARPSGGSQSYEAEVRPPLRVGFVATPEASRDAHATSGQPLNGGSTAWSPLHESYTVFGDFQPARLVKVELDS
jgi:hypothetical protein